MISEKKPVCAYDTTKQAIIGVFESINAASKYLYGEYWLNSKQSLVAQAVRNKSKLTKTIYPFKVAVRAATPQQVAAIPNGQAAVIYEGYTPLKHERQHGGFDSGQYMRNDIKYNKPHK